MYFPPVWGTFSITNIRQQLTHCIKTENLVDTITSMAVFAVSGKYLNFVHMHSYGYNTFKCFVSHLTTLMRWRVNSITMFWLKKFRIYETGDMKVLLLYLKVFKLMYLFTMFWKISVCLWISGRGSFHYFFYLRASNWSPIYCCFRNALAAVPSGPHQVYCPV